MRGNPATKGGDRIHSTLSHFAYIITILLAIQVSISFLCVTVVSKSPRTPLQAAKSAEVVLDQNYSSMNYIYPKRGEKLNKAFDVSPKALDENAMISACLLIKDENDILSEWIAYHYFVMKMRRLLVVVDPLSSESPSQIFDKYREWTDLEIIEWSDKDFMHPEFLRTNTAPLMFQMKASNDVFVSDEKMRAIGNHRYRQSTFLASCLREMKRRGSSWVIHVDTDEFVSTKNPFKERIDQEEDEEDLMEDSVLKRLQKDLKSKSLHYPCYSVLRIPFGSSESTVEEREKSVPNGFDARQFKTLRWRYHNIPENMTLTQHYPKMIVDVSALPYDRLPENLAFSIHRPIWDICNTIQEPAEHTELYKNQSIVANHYLGSWERYSGRKDERRTREIFDLFANVQGEAYDGIRPWLSELVDLAGHAVVAELFGERYLKHTLFEGDFSAVTI